VAFTPILGTLAYVVDRARDAVLLVHRNARADDEHLGKWNGLGGKIEAGEHVTASLRRELREEAEIELTSFALRGTISWPGFGANGEDWFGFVYLVDGWTGTPPAANPEGTLAWIPVTRVLAACSEDPTERSDAALPMWEGDRYFLPLVFDDDPRAFSAVLPYVNGRPAGWSCERS
jgi:8-oxo-dGTP diphosphatase